MTRDRPLLRPIRADDAAAVAALIRQSFAAIPETMDPPPSALGETAESVGAQIAAGGGAVAACDGRVVAAVLWGERDGGLYVGRLSVDPAWRRFGLARSLMGLAEDAARAMGMPQMQVGVRLVLAGNRALFASLGFHETALHTHEGYAAPTWVSLEKQVLPR